VFQDGNGTAADHRDDRQAENKHKRKDLWTQDSIPPHFVSPLQLKNLSAPL